MNNPAFFGYGSLVNLATHDYPNARPATLTGWRRIWRKTAQGPQAFLSVERADGVQIAGVVADVPGADWAALDLREAGYERHDVSHLIGHDGVVGPTSVYEVRDAHLQDANNPILLSYLDVVVQGFLRVHGKKGVAAFFATTAGWDTPILDDRANPRYPRHQPLTADERALVDSHLAVVKKA